MGRPILILRLEAPLQSWGSRSRWDVRDTATEPTKSGIIGLLGCALGYSMQDPQLEQLNSALRFGLRVEHPGRVVIDYQTITDYLPTAAGDFKFGGGASKGPPEKLIAELKEPATIQSPRSYIEDGAFLVVLESTDPGNPVINECARAVQQPRWPTYLGRKACVPTRPVFEAVTEDYADIEDALRRLPWSWLGRCCQSRRSLRPVKLDAFAETASNDFDAGITMRQDVVRINKARIYGYHGLKRFTVENPTT